MLLLDPEVDSAEGGSRRRWEEGGGRRGGWAGTMARERRWSDCWLAILSVSREPRVRLARDSALVESALVESAFDLEDRPAVEDCEGLVCCLWDDAFDVDVETEGDFFFLVLAVASLSDAEDADRDDFCDFLVFLEPSAALPDVRDSDFDSAFDFVDFRPTLALLFLLLLAPFPVTLLFPHCLLDSNLDDSDMGVGDVVDG